jgi:methionyl-tRNA formyltransferase
VRVVFFGTPEFAVPSLRALVGEGFDVVAVVTQPDKPQGRSRSRLVPPPVKIAADAEELLVLQPDKPTDRGFVARLQGLEPRPDIGVVVAYGHILKPEVLALPARGMVNVHPSLLPELRGAAPVEWAIIRGLEETGVTIMQMTAGMDSGPILHQIPHHVDPDVTGGELSDHLAEVGALALVETLTLVEEDALRPVPQDDSRATYAPKLTREIARIDWTKGAAAIARLIRGLDPRPGAWTELDGAELKLFSARATGSRGEPGEVLTADGPPGPPPLPPRLLIAAGDGGAVEVEEVQPAGKERMHAGEWLRGARLAAGRRFV